MALQNWWLSGRGDSHSSPKSWGSGRSKEDGFELHVYMRQENESVEALTLAGFVDGDDLRLEIHRPDKPQWDVSIRSKR